MREQTHTYIHTAEMTRFQRGEAGHLSSGQSQHTYTHTYIHTYGTDDTLPARRGRSPQQWSKWEEEIKVAMHARKDFLKDLFDVSTGLYVCVYIYIYVCMYIYMYIPVYM